MYGLLSWLVNDRRRELAIRLALWAQPTALARVVTIHGLVLALVGIVLGTLVAQFAAGLMQGVLFETRPTDPAAIVSAGAIVLVSAVACFAPARRAARVAPIEGLKEM